MSKSKTSKKGVDSLSSHRKSQDTIISVKKNYRLNDSEAVFSSNIPPLAKQ